MNKKRGFTMVEITVTIAIVGVLLALALPNVRWYVVRMASQEAKSVLIQVFDAQKDVFRDTDDYASGDDILDSDTNPSLGIELMGGSTELKNFSQVNAYDIGDNETVSCAASNIVIADAEETNSLYTLAILDNGEIVCHDGSGDCDHEACTRIGF